MIQVYSPGNEDFTKNGDCTLLPETASVHAVLSGAWSAELVHPIDVEGRWRYLVEEAVVKMPSFNGDQLFRIRKPEKSDMGVVCTMEPIFYDARNVFLDDVRPTAMTGQEALNYLCTGTPFSGVSNIIFRGTAYYEYKNLLEALLGDEDNAFVNRWGGEPIFDNYTVTINTRAGSDHNVEIRYGKNIPENGMDIETDMTSVVTRIYPKSYNGHKMSGRGYIDSPLINRYAMVYPRTITYSDVMLREDASEEDLENPEITICDNQAELNNALRIKCEEDYDNNIDKPLITITCDMILLQNTEQYADIADLETVSLGDTVRCYNNHLDFTTSARVVELTYDSTKKRVDNVTLGAYRQSFLDILNKRISGIDDLAERAGRAMNADGSIMAERIRGFLNGAVTSLHAMYNVAEHQDYIAILFENLDTTSDLFGALAIGTQGWMISKRRNAAGTDWIWTTAATAAGIVANTIVTGAISDAAANNYWDLDTGEFRLASTATVGGKTVPTIASEAGAAAVNGQTQESIFNKLTNNGVTQGIYLQNGKLYLNASYILTGIFRAKNGDTETFYVNAATGMVKIIANTFQMSNGDTIQSIAEGKASAAVNAQTQQSIFNKLTNNGQTQGIYLQNGKLYINASYIATGILKDVGENTMLNLSTGALTMKKGSINIGDHTFNVTTSGDLTAKSATIKGTIESNVEVDKELPDGRTKTYNQIVKIENGRLNIKRTDTSFTLSLYNDDWIQEEWLSETTQPDSYYFKPYSIISASRLFLDVSKLMLEEADGLNMKDAKIGKTTNVTVGGKVLKFKNGILYEVDNAI